jgi:hypothetical protein
MLWPRLDGSSWFTVNLGMWHLLDWYWPEGPEEVVVRPAKRGRIRPSVMTVTAGAARGGDGRGVGAGVDAAPQSWRTTPMSDIALAPSSSTGRIYGFDLPVKVPFLAIGLVVSKFKQIGVWDKMPAPIKQKTKKAKASWSGVTITKTDLDSLPEEVWLTMARELRLEWRYADAA